MSSSIDRESNSGASQVVYHQVLRPPSNSMAIAALVLGIVAIVLGVWIIVPIVGLVFAFLSFVPAVLAAIFGFLGLRQSNQVGVGRGPAVTGLVLGGLTLAIGVLTTMFWIVTIAGSVASNSGS